MNFSDELRNEISCKKQMIENEKINHVVETDFVEHLVELIKEECKKEARNQKRYLECVLTKDNDNDYRLAKGSLVGGVHTLCYGFFGTYPIRSTEGAEKMHHNEDDRFIVNELKNKLNELGFSSVDVNLTYSSKRETKHSYQKNFFSMRPVESVIIHKNYYKNLYIKVEW